MGRNILLFLLLAWTIPVFAATAPTGNVEGKDSAYNDHGKRDPFWKLVSPNGTILTHENDLTFSDLVLEGILADSNGKSIAIINGRVIKENDYLGSFSILKVTANAVVLQRGQERFILKLKKEE